MKNCGINSITISSISHATEDENKVLEAMSDFIPEDINEDDVDIETVQSEGCFGNPIYIHKITIKKEKSAKKVFNHIVDLIKSDINNIFKINKDIDLRIDKNKLYLRFNKQKAYLGNYEITDGDDVIRIVINFKIFAPKNKENIVKDVVLSKLKPKFKKLEE